MYYAEFKVERLGINEVEGIFYEWLEEDVSENLLEDWGFGKEGALVGVFVEFKESGINSGIYLEILLSRYVIAGGQVDVIKEY